MANLTQHNPPEEWPNEWLVLAAALGDVRSFDVLALRYRAAIYRVAQVIAGHEHAEDIVQEALLLAFKALPGLAEPDKFAAWLYAITRHAAYRHGQRAQREREQRVALDEALLQYSAAFTQPFVARETDDTGVRAAVAQLPPELRVLIALRYDDEWPLQRIADFLDLPLTTVKWRLHRAKQLLKAQLAPPAPKTKNNVVRRALATR